MPVYFFNAAFDSRDLVDAGDAREKPKPRLPVMALERLPEYGPDNEPTTRQRLSMSPKFVPKHLDSDERRNDGGCLGHRAAEGGSAHYNGKQGAGKSLLQKRRRLKVEDEDGSPPQGDRMKPVILMRVVPSFACSPLCLSKQSDVKWCLFCQKPFQK